MGTPDHAFPLFPPLVSGLPGTGEGETPHPLELDFDYARLDRENFLASTPGLARGLETWQPLMPPLVAETNLGEGNTPLLESPRLAATAGFSGQLFIKDEGRNPTWSHKDRLNRCTVSAARLSGAPGVIVASSGNHGASASAYAAAAGLPCIILASSTAPLAMQAFVAAYGGAALAVPPAARWSLMERLRQITGYHPVSNLTAGAHTGHSFAIEGYKSIAYEIVRDLGGDTPGSVFIPTGYGELIYGVWKGFEELRMLGLTDRVPRLYSCESAVYGVLYRAMRDGVPVAQIQPNTTTQALSIATPVGGLRGRRALEQSGGEALALSDAAIEEARLAMAKNGLWVEFSAAAALAGLRQLAGRGSVPEGPAICISTATGLKDVNGSGSRLPETDGTLDHAVGILRDVYGLAV